VCVHQIKKVRLCAFVEPTVFKAVLYHPDESQVDGHALVAMECVPGHVVQRNRTATKEHDLG
jgi:hypothetical protein